MAKLMKVYEKFRNKELQVIILWCEATNREQLDNNSYDDFYADLYIDGKYIADISHVLSDAGLFTEMVDAVEWAEMLREEVCHED